MGSVLKHLGMIPVSRGSRSSGSSGASLHKGSESSGPQDGFLQQGKTILQTQRRPVVIFPEGTRTLPGQQTRYRKGVIHLAKYTDSPIIPLALNSGIFWPRHTFFKKSGRIDVIFLPPIIPGDQNDSDLLQQLQHRIETVSFPITQ